MSIMRLMAVVQAIVTSHCVAAASAAAQSPLYTANGDSALAALIGEALDRNPRVRGAFLEYRAAESRVPQVSALPDPALSFTQHVLGPQTRVGPQLSSVSLSQSFPWFGTRSDRGEMAAAEAGIRNESHETQRAEVVRRVKLAWYDLAYLDRALRITGEEEQLLLHYEALARARYSQGSGQQQEAVKLQAEVTRVLNRRQELLRQRTDSEATLNALVNRPVATPIPPVEIGHRPQVRVDAAALEAAGLAARPEVAAARLTVDRNAHAVSLAKRLSRPGLTVGIAWGNVLARRDDPGLANPPQGNGQDQFSLTFGASLPVFGAAYDAAEAEASARLAASEEAYLDVVSGVALGVRSTAFHLATIDTQLGLFERALLPQAEQALSATEEAYSAGVTGVLELLDSEKLLLDVRLGLARLQADYMKALAEMERAVGSAFPEVGS